MWECCKFSVGLVGILQIFSRACGKVEISSRACGKLSIEKNRACGKNASLKKYIFLNRVCGTYTFKIAFALQGFSAFNTFGGAGGDDDDVSKISNLDEMASPCNVFDLQSTTLVLGLVVATSHDS